MQRGVHFDPLRLPLLGGCVYGTSVRRRRGCRRWCRSVICPVVDSRRDNSTGTLGVLCVYSGVCCAVLCASTTLLLLRSVVRVRARAHTPSRDVLCVWSSLLRALLPYGGGGAGWLASKRQVRWGLVSLFYKSSLRLNVGNIHGTFPCSSSIHAQVPNQPIEASEAIVLSG